MMTLNQLSVGVESGLKKGSGFECQDTSTTFSSVVGSFCIRASDDGATEQARFTLAQELSQQELDHESALEMLYPKNHLKCAERIIKEELSVDEPTDQLEVVAVSIPSSHPASLIARRLETDLFSHYFDVDPAQHEIDYAPYLSASSFVLALQLEVPGDLSSRLLPAGVIRFIEPSAVGLKTLNVLVEEGGIWEDAYISRIDGFKNADRSTRLQLLEAYYGISAATTVDVATMAVDPRFTGAQNNFSSAYALYGSVVQYAGDQRGFESMSALQDRQPLMVMQSRFDKPWSYEKSDDMGHPYEGPNIVFPTVMPSISAYKARLMAKHLETKAADPTKLSSYDHLYLNTNPVIASVSRARLVPPSRSIAA